MGCKSRAPKNSERKQRQHFHKNTAFQPLLAAVMDVKLGAASVEYALTGGKDIPDHSANKVQRHRHAPHLTP